MNDKLGKELSEAKKEIDYLKRCLAYLAECNAGSYERAKDLKSYPKYRRNRLKSIVTKSADMLNGSWHPKTWHRKPEEEIEDALDRLKKSLEED